MLIARGTLSNRSYCAAQAGCTSGSRGRDARSRFEAPRCTFLVGTRLGVALPAAKGILETSFTTEVMGRNPSAPKDTQVPAQHSPNNELVFDPKKDVAHRRSDLA